MRLRWILSKASKNDFLAVFFFSLDTRYSISVAIHQSRDDKFELYIGNNAQEKRKECGQELAFSCMRSSDRELPLWIVCGVSCQYVNSIRDRISTSIFARERESRYNMRLFAFTECHLK